MEWKLKIKDYLQTLIASIKMHLRQILFLNDHISPCRMLHISSIKHAGAVWPLQKEVQVHLEVQVIHLGGGVRFCLVPERTQWCRIDVFINLHSAKVPVVHYFPLIAPSWTAVCAPVKSAGVCERVFFFKWIKYLRDAFILIREW